MTGPTVRLASVVRRPMFTRALALLIGLPLLLVAWPSAASADSAHAPSAAVDGASLLISIDSMTPSYLADEGPIQIRGRITNRDDVAWEAINLYPFVSSAPMTTRAELAEAARAGRGRRFVGERMTDVSANVDVLQPGASTTFSITVPRSLITAEITGEPGVYWFGVHAIARERRGASATTSPTAGHGPSCR